MNVHVLVVTRYHEAKLVHGDLSEYNILWHRKQLWFIDVSQSVEHDHPSAFDFLRKDCENITAFFRAKGWVVCPGLYSWTRAPSVFAS
eukprot:SAG22_NODE_68_length_22846_cov_32.458258_8_plen_88_part_00